MGQTSQILLDRFEEISNAAQAVLRYDVEDRVATAQYEQEFEEGIKVANDVTADLIADLHHLIDYHGQDWDAILASAAEKYAGHKEAVAS